MHKEAKKIRRGLHLPPIAVAKIVASEIGLGAHQLLLP
jgi:hypothetical protein